MELSGGRPRPTGDRVVAKPAVRRRAVAVVAGVNPDTHVRRGGIALQAALPR